ncbi:hypothetical protein [Candidatus Lokiarchaeum ossiferum]|uniref:hypothetical protein n=1 Tax=Candidatus Lokiarchaeum ossiferum TaxID=2951803 RepID=UPI00352CE103
MKNLHTYRFKEGKEAIFSSLLEQIQHRETFCDFNHGYKHGDAFLRYLRGPEFLTDCKLRGIFGVDTEQIGSNRGNTRVFFQLPPKPIQKPIRNPIKLVKRLKMERRITINGIEE